MRMEQGTYEPHELPSMLVGKPLPKFSLPAQPPSQGFSNSEIISGKLPALVNFFASWCLPCIEEAPNLARLRELGVPLWGIAYKDKTDATDAFLDQHGDPYLRVARDASGMTAINFGLYGVPETYVVDKGGIVRRRIPGGISQEMMRDSILPLLLSLG